MNERVIVREDFDDEVPLVLVMILVSVSVPILMLILILSRLIAAVPAAALDTNVPDQTFSPRDRDGMNIRNQFSHPLRHLQPLPQAQAQADGIQKGGEIDTWKEVHEDISIRDDLVGG